jgi:type I restriction enzyme S subunit
MEEVKLGTLTNRKIGYGIVQPGDNVVNGVPVIKVNNIISGLRNVRDLDTTSIENDIKYSRTKLLGGELIISVVGTIGKTAIVPIKFKGCNLVRATALIDILDSQLTLWVKYYLDSPKGQLYIKGNLNTTVQPTLNVKSLVEMPIPMFSSAYRNHAVAILKSLDDKIECNNRINENLEQQAQALFKSWFVDFEPFKDQPFVESELGMIPKGWMVYSLSDFLPVITGKKDANVARGGVYPFFSCSQEQSWTDDYSFEGSAILVAGNGDFNVKMYTGKFEAYQRTYVLIPHNPYYTAWLYYAVKYHLDTITSAARGSVIKFITKGNLAVFKFPAPIEIGNAKIIYKFDVIRKIIARNIEESRLLAELRDTLLPRLMSGEINVGDIKI